MVEKLPKEKAGELFMLILEYVNDRNPKTDDLVLQIAFEPIRQQLKRDLKKYESILKKRSDAGKASADKRKHKETHLNTSQQVLTNDKSVQQASTNSTDSDSDSDSDSVKDTVINIKRVPGEEEFLKYCREEITEIPYDQHIINYKSKYKAWKEAGWNKEKDGKQIPIKNWKSTIRQCVPHFKPHAKQIIPTIKTSEIPKDVRGND